MMILHSLSELSEIRGELCVAIGVFDGVHLGHQALIRRAMAEADRIAGTVASPDISSPSGEGFAAAVGAAFADLDPAQGPAH